MVHSMELSQSSTDEAGQSGNSHGGWVFPALLAVALLLALGISQRVNHDDSSSQLETAANKSPSLAAVGETVSLEIDFGNGATQRFDALPWQPEMTVSKLMEIASQFRPGITFSQKGEGETGFLTAIEGLANEGATGRNWKYQVDGDHGQISYCLQNLTPGQHVLWKFAAEE